MPPEYLKTKWNFGKGTPPRVEGAPLFDQQKAVELTRISVSPITILFSLNARDSAMILFPLPSSTLHIYTVRLPDRKILL